jgi:hypothetical protein
MMLHRASLAVALTLSLTLVTAAASADPVSDDHFEATMGFLATGLDHTATGFVADGHNLALTDTFRAAPYDSAVGYGLRYDVRLVLSHVRMTAGLDLPFSSLGNVATRRADEHDVAPRDLGGWAVRFGLGAEYRLGDVTPFADLQGALMHATTTVMVDGSARDYAANRFGFSMRAGFKVHLRPWFFVAASGEYGLVGASRWGADVSVGFRVGT